MNTQILESKNCIFIKFTRLYLLGDKSVSVSGIKNENMSDQQMSRIITQENYYKIQEKKSTPNFYS